jgi:hypothetical protein
VYITHKSNDYTYGRALRIYEGGVLLASFSPEEYGSDGYDISLFHFNRAGTQAVALTYDYDAAIVNVVMLELTANGSSIVPSITILATYDTASYEVDLETHDYSWPDWWKNSEGEWPPYPLPSDVTAYYNYPFLYEANPASQSAHYNYHYAWTIISGTFPVAVDWDWNDEENEGLKYIWYKVNYAYQGEENFSWDSVFIPSPISEEREITFWEEHWDVDQEAHRIVIELGAEAITKDFVTYGLINYPWRLDAYQDISVALVDYWNKPNGTGDQTITRSAYDGLPETHLNGNPIYVNPLGIVGPSLNTAAGSYQYTYTPGSTYIDLRDGFMYMTETARAYDYLSYATWPARYENTGTTSYTQSATEEKIVHSLYLRGQQVFSETVAEYDKYAPASGSGTLASKYSIILPNWHEKYFTRDPNHLFSTNGRMPNGVYDLGSGFYDNEYDEVSWPLDGSNYDMAFYALSSDRNWHFYGLPVSDRFVSFTQTHASYPDPGYLNLLGKGLSYTDASAITGLSLTTNFPRYTLFNWTLLKAYNE